MPPYLEGWQILPCYRKQKLIFLFLKIATMGEPDLIILLRLRRNKVYIEQYTSKQFLLPMLL